MLIGISGKLIRSITYITTQTLEDLPRSSDLVETHVAVELQGSPVPVRDSLPLWQSSDPLGHQLADLV